MSLSLSLRKAGMAIHAGMADAGVICVTSDLRLVS